MEAAQAHADYVARVAGGVAAPLQIMGSSPVPEEHAAATTTTSEPAATVTPPRSPPVQSAQPQVDMEMLYGHTHHAAAGAPNAQMMAQNQMMVQSPLTEEFMQEQREMMRQMQQQLMDQQRMMHMQMGPQM